MKRRKGCGWNRNRRGRWTWNVGSVRAIVGGPQTLETLKTVTDTKGPLSPVPSSSSPNGAVHDRSRFFISALSYARTLRTRGHHPRKSSCRPSGSLPVPTANGRSAPLSRFCIIILIIILIIRRDYANLACVYSRATGYWKRKWQSPGFPPSGTAHARREGWFWITAARCWRSDEQSENE